MFIDKPFQGHQGGTQSLRGFVGDASVASRRSQGLPGISLAAGPERENHVLYSSHTICASQEDFAAWTKSEQFRAAHGYSTLGIGNRGIVWRARPTDAGTPCAFFREEESDAPKRALRKPVNDQGVTPPKTDRV